MKTTSKKKALALACAALAVAALALAACLASCSAEGDAAGIGGSKAIASALDGSIGGIDAEPRADDGGNPETAEENVPSPDEGGGHDAATEAGAEPSAASGADVPSTPKEEPQAAPERPAAPSRAQSDPAPQKKWVEETEQVWVEDRAAWSESVPTYGAVEVSICNVCGADVTGNAAAHGKAHMKAGEGSGHHSEVRQEIIGYDTVSHPAEGHWESRVVGGHWE